MSVNKIRTCFSKYTDSSIQIAAEFILECMTDNPDFTDPQPPLDEIREALVKYSADLIASTGHDRNLLAQKRARRKILEELLSQLGMFVMFKAKGNIVVLSGSGFPLAKLPEPVYLTNPGNVTLSHGITSGELVSVVKAVNGAKIYLYEILDHEPTGTSVWHSHRSTRSRFVFTGLKPGNKYWVRVAAIGIGKQIAYSTVASMFVA